MELPKFYRVSRGEEVETFVNPNAADNGPEHGTLVSLDPRSKNETGPFININAISKLEVRYCAKNTNPKGLALYSLGLGEKVIDAMRHYTITLSNNVQIPILANPESPISESLEQIYLNAVRL